LLKLYEDEKQYGVMLCYDKDEALIGTPNCFKAFQLSKVMNQLLLFLEHKKAPTAKKL